MVLWLWYIELSTPVPFCSRRSKVEATSPSFEQGSLPWLVRHQSKVSKAEETRKNGKMIKKKLVYF